MFSGKCPSPTQHVFYPHRVTCCNRHYCDTGGNATASFKECKGDGKKGKMYEQPEADWVGDVYVYG